MYRNMLSSNLYFALSLLTIQHYLQTVGIISLISSRQLIWLQTELMDFFFFKIIVYFIYEDKTTYVPPHLYIGFWSS